MTEPRFLVVRLGSLGDIVHTFPAVAALRDSFPAAEIVWLTHPRWSALVAASGLASQIWTVDSRDLSSLRAAIDRIRASRWTAAIDYQGLWKSATLPFLGGVSKRIGFSSATIREFGVPILYTDRVRVARAHIAEQNGELSLRAGASNICGPVRLRAAQPDVDALRTQLAARGIDRYVVLSPGGGWRFKCWPAERFGQLARKIQAELGLPCVINYGPGEAELVQAVQASAGDPPLPSYNQELSALMALLQCATCIVGGDTGPLHLAVALGTPAVALFGPTDPARNGPYPPGDIVLRSPTAVTTYKRHDSPAPSLLEISVNDVFEAVRRCLGASA